MKHRKTKAAFLAAVMAFVGWRGAVETRQRPLTELFNAKTAMTDNTPEYRLPSLVMPKNEKEVWRIRIGSWEMAHSGHHTFMEFGPVDEKPGDRDLGGNVFQIHGIAMNAVTKEHASLNFESLSSYKSYFEGQYVLKVLGANEDFNKDWFHKKPDAYVDVFYGSKEDVLRMYMDAMRLAQAINDENKSYKLLDQNSNSVQRTLLEGLGLNVPDIYEPHVLMKDSSRIWVPGIEWSLMPPGWDRQQARDADGSDRLSGNELEQAAREISRSTKGIWVAGNAENEHRPAPGPG